jgi:hypothetical protein
LNASADLPIGLNDVIQHLNRLVADSVTGQVPVRTTKELKDLLKSPPKREFSVALEEAMTTVVKMFGTADETNRCAITSLLSSWARRGLSGYAADMAVLAVRRQSPALIEHGLAAVVIEGASQDNWAWTFKWSL